MNLIIKKLLLSVLLVLLNLFATDGVEAETITSAEQKEIINQIGRLLKGNYIYPENVSKYQNFLMNRLDKGSYKRVRSKQEFGKQLSNDLFSVSQDLHFSVAFSPDNVKFLRNSEDQSKQSELKERDRLESELNNHKFVNLQILNGNVGYLRFDYFADPEFAHDLVASSIEFIGNTDALIIDLRNNNGGHMELSQLIMSYLLEYEDDLALYDYYYNDDGKRVARKMWILPSVSGKRYLNKPVYILTSSFTFSAAEWMAYVLKNRGRAVIVGEKTPGGAHPVGAKVINDDFVINIPIGEVKDPLSNSDFEGVGVKPDIQADFSQALNIAHKNALETLKKDFPNKSNYYDWHIERIYALMNPIQLSDELLAKYQGQFGVRKIWKEGNHIFYNWNNKGRFKLIPMSENKFMFESLDDFRFKMILDKGKLKSLMRLEKDGSSREYQRADW